MENLRQETAQEVARNALAERGMISKHGLVGKHWKISGLEHLKQDCFKCFPKRTHSLVCLKPGYPDSNG